MSQVIIAGDTSGTITLQAPAVSGSSVLTLPATTATLATLTTPSFASTIGVGAATASASGAGITFPATQSASSNANTLDDYEEGTWTPSVGGTATYNAGNSGTYTKVGRIVTCNFDITINTIGTGSTSYIVNFPFTNSSMIATGSVSYYANIATATNFISFYIDTSATNCNFVGNTANATNIGLNGFAIFGNSTRVLGAVTYATT